MRKAWYGCSSMFSTECGPSSPSTSRRRQPDHRGAVIRSKCPTRGCGRTGARRRCVTPRAPASDAGVTRTSRLRRVDPHQRRGRLYLAVCRLSTTRAGAWLAINFAWKLDPHLLKLTRGRWSSAWPVAAALLETRGARTGEPRRTATLYFHDGDRVTVVAALRGSPRNPAWYDNLRANPDVLFGGLRFRAEVVEDERSGAGCGTLPSASTRSTPTSPTGAAWRRSAASGASSTARRLAARRSGRTVPTGARRAEVRLVAAPRSL